MGSKSRSNTASTQNTDEIVTSVGDNRVTDNGNIGGNVTLGRTGGDVSVQTTDLGAIEESFGLAGVAIEGVKSVAGDGFDFAEELAINAQDNALSAQNDAFNLAGTSLAANATLSNELIRRDQIVTASINDALGETRAGFDEVANQINSNASATGDQLAGLASVAGSNTNTVILAVAAAAALFLVVRAKK